MTLTDTTAPCADRAPRLELVLARDISFHSLCQHHVLPFTGVAHVGYLPGDRILGLSKLAVTSGAVVEPGRLADPGIPLEAVAA